MRRAMSVGPMLAAVAALALSGAAQARQDDDRNGPRVRPAPAVAPKAVPESTAPQADDQSAEARALNRTIIDNNAEVQRRNAAALAEYEARQAEYRAALDRQRAEADRLKAEDAAARRAYEAEMAAWRARVAACNAGDRSQCQ